MFQSFAVVFPFLCFVLPWIYFYNSSLCTPPTVPNDDDHSDGCLPVSQVQVQAKNPHKDKTKPKLKINAMSRLNFYFTAPITKFHFNMVEFCVSLS